MDPALVMGLVVSAPFVLFIIGRILSGGVCRECGSDSLCAECKQGPFGIDSEPPKERKQ